MITAATRRPSLSMLGWAYNEAENIGDYLQRAEAFLRSVSADFELVLLDDGSTDDTVAIARAYQQTRPWLRIYSNERNRGSGYNTRRAIALARKEYLLWQTVDWSYDITCLGSQLHRLEEFDVLQGVRLDTLSWRGLRRRSDNLVKAVISLGNYLLVRLLFRLPVHDYQNVTVYPTRLIQSITLESESAFTNPECLLKAWWKGARIQEVPVPFCKRQRGEAKGTRPRVVWASCRDVVCWWWRWIILGQRQDKGHGSVRYWNDGMASSAPPTTRAAA